MKIVLFLFFAAASAQTVDYSRAEATRPFRQVSSAPSGACFASEGWRELTTNGALYRCVNGLWSELTAGLGGASTITAENNTVAFAATAVRYGNTTYAIANGTCTFSMGNGEVYVYVNYAGNLICHYDSDLVTTPPTVTGSFAPLGTGTPGYPENSIPLAFITLTAGVPVVTRSDLSTLSTVALLAGSGILVQQVAGVATVLIDPAQIPTLGGTNTFTGSLDFALAQSVRLPTFASNPATCSVGMLGHNSTATAGQICTATNTWSRITTGFVPWSRSVPMAARSSSGTGLWGPGVFAPTTNGMGVTEGGGTAPWALVAGTFPTSATTTANVMMARLPASLDITGGLNVRLWYAPGTGASAGQTIAWTVATSCIGPSDTVSLTGTGPTFNAANTFTTTGLAASTSWRFYTISGSVTTTGCDAGDILWLQIQRVATSDTLSATALLLEVEVSGRMTGVN